MTALVIEVQGLTKTYPGGTQAVKPTDLTITNGVFALLGPNGSGKTTFMRMLATLLEPTAGTATVDGHDIRRDRLGVRRLLGYLPQDFGLYPTLTVEEHLDYIALLGEITSPADRREAIDRVMAQANLENLRRRRVGELSGGMRQRLGVAQALITAPQLIIIDEPTAGLDPEERIRIRSLLAELGGDRTVILSTHIVADAEATADSLIILHLGEVLFTGTTDDLLARSRGRVWMVEVPRERLHEMKQQYIFTGVYRAGDKMHVRVVADAVDQPAVGAERALPVEPTLEDAYLDVMGAATGANSAA